MRFIHTCIFTAAILFVVSGSLFAGTSFNITPNSAILGPFVSYQDIDDVESTYGAFPRAFFNKNSDVLPTGMALVNTLGYPNGKSIIKKFPHFEAGVAAGAGVYKYDRYEDFDSETLENNPVIPGGGANGSVHFGTGIGKRTDITFKFLWVGPFYSYDDTFDESDSNQDLTVRIHDTDIFSIGAKFRYRLIDRKRLVPFVFTFGGISTNLSVDYLKTYVKTSVDFSKTESVDFRVQDPFDPAESDLNTVGLVSTVTGEAVLNTNLLSVTPEILVYFDLFYLFSIYTGPSAMFNFGAFNFDIDARGQMVNDAPLTVFSDTLGYPLELVAADQEVSTARLESTNRLQPQRIIPKWTVGLEINLWVLKIQAEVAAVLTSYTDSATAQVGVRVDF